MLIVGANLAGTMTLIGKYYETRSDIKHIRKDVDDLKKDNRRFNKKLNDFYTEFKLFASKTK